MESSGTVGSGRGTSVVVSFACPDEATGISTAALTRLLDASERARLTRIVSAAVSRQFLVAHALLRVSLSRHLAIPPAEWRFARSHTGRPVISGPVEPTSLSFSLTHTSGLVMCAVSDDHTVGIDAERIDAEANFALLVPQVLSPHEASLWTAADVSSRAKRFHQLWALKESLLKAAGLGLRMAPSRISFELAEGSPPSAERLPEELGSVDDWSFFVSEPTPAHACALAVKAPSFDFARVEWREVSTEELVESALGRFDEVVLAGAAHASVNPTNSRVADRCL